MRSGELGAAPHAVARGIPHVTVAFGSGLADYAIPLVERDLAPVWASVGLAPPSMSDIAGDVYLHPFPKSMGYRPAFAQLAELRPANVVDSAGDVPDWVESFGETRPPVYVTAGTTPIVATLAPWKPTFEALDRFDVDVLVTIGPKFPVEELGPLPLNVRVERFVPQSLILDRVALVISHAGAGTMLAAAGQGVPQLLIPTWADQWENSDALARTGSGILLEENERDSAAIHQAVNSLMHDTAYRDAASALATEVAAMPGPDDHVSTIERLVSIRPA
jgi:calicheamicin 3'-O-methyl-rhamnosyltransferase